MQKQQYGVNAAYLGPQIRKTPVMNPGIEGWKDALTLDQFFRASGRPGATTPTTVQLSWDEDNLYVLVINQETVENEDQKRRDIDDVVISSGSLGHRDFAVFTIGRDGQGKAFLEKGMTYIGGGEALGGTQPNEHFERPDNEAEITDIPKNAYEVVEDHGCGYWSAAFTLPWRVIGGFPKDDRFYFQVYRKKQTTSEILCPTALDEYINLPYWFEYDPSTFIEAYLGGEPHPVYGTELFAELPSGIRRWTRYTEVFPASEKEFHGLWQELEKRKPTSDKNAADHVKLAQRLQDVFFIEGIDFFWDEAGSRPFVPREPWNERHVFNEWLLEGKKKEAYERLDSFLDWLVTYIHWYFTDGTLADQSDNWSAFAQLKSVSAREKQVILDFGEGHPALALIFCDHGVRLRTADGGGLFNAAEEEFELYQDEHEARVQSAHATAVITLGKNWNVSIRVDGRKVFDFNKDSLATVTAPGKDGFRLNLPLAEGETVIGFGEKFDDVDQRGHIIAMYDRDTYLSILGGLANESYKIIPLIHFSDHGALFINSTYRMRVDVGATEQGRFSVSVQDPHIDLYFWGGTPEENMQSYARLTGLPLLPPRWVFAPWAGGGGGRWANGPLHDVVEEQIGVLEKFKELDIPHKGFYAEGAGRWGDKTPEYQKISDFAEKNGVHAFSWEFSVMPEERAKEFLKGSGDVENLPLTTTPDYHGDMKYVTYIDFTHPRAQELLQAQWKERFYAGIRGTMVDFGDKIPDEARFYDGRTGKEMHNGYALDYAKGYRKLFEDAYGDDHVLYQRNGAAGCQSYTCQFGGDQPTSFQGMKQSMDGLLTVSASGLPFWGVDACGYDGFAGSDAETYMRWTQWAAFCPIMRYHGTAPKEPWEYTEQVTQMYKFYAWLRMNLLRYSYSSAVETHHTGIPMARALPLAFPDDKAVAHVDDEYLYGDHLLVAPIYTEENEKKVVFPAGRYVNLFHNEEVVDGDQTISRTYPVTEIPVYVGAGAVIPAEVNESLQLGMSMTTSKVNALILTKPVENTCGSWYGSDTEKNDYSYTVTKNGFDFHSAGCGEEKYLIVKGVPSVSAVAINGKELEKKPAKQGLNLHEAYYVAEDGTVYIRLYMHGDLHVIIAE